LQPTKREDAKDVVFATEEYKWKAVVQEIRHMHKSGRPVLVGTTSVERSEGLAGQLDTAGIQYQVPCADHLRHLRAAIHAKRRCGGLMC
jgi:preprotein translocase subunit SecA